MGNVVDVILFKGECCFHLILHYIYHVILLRDLVVVNPLPQPPT